MTKQDTGGGHRDRRSECVALVAVDLKSSGLITESGAKRHATDSRRVSRVSDKRQHGMRTCGIGEEIGRTCHRFRDHQRRVSPRERADVPILESIPHKEIARQTGDAEYVGRVRGGERGVDRRCRATLHVLEAEHKSRGHPQMRRHGRYAGGGRNAGGGENGQTDVDDVEKARSAHRLAIVEARLLSVNHLKGLRREYYA